MQVLNPCEALLCEYDVLQHLSTQKQKREATPKSPLLKSIEQVPLAHWKTVEFEVLSFLKSRPAATQSHTAIESFLKSLLAYPLTKNEKRQLVDLRPISLVALHNIIEQCDERLTEQQMEEVLELIQTHLPPSPEQQQQMELVESNS